MRPRSKLPTDRQRDAPGHAVAVKQVADVAGGYGKESRQREAWIEIRRGNADPRSLSRQRPLAAADVRPLTQQIGRDGNGELARRQRHWGFRLQFVVEGTGVVAEQDRQRVEVDIELDLQAGDLGLGVAQIRFGLNHVETGGRARVVAFPGEPEGGPLRRGIWSRRIGSVSASRARRRSSEPPRRTRSP